MIQGTSTAEDYQSREVDSENPKQGQEKLISESQTQKLTEPLFFLKDLDEDIDRRLKAIQGQTEDQIKDGNNREKLETNSPDPHCNTDKKEEMTNVSNDSCQPDSHTSRPNKASNSSLKPSLKQASNSKIPKPVRSQRSNLGIIQQPASKVSHSCRTVPVADRKTTPTSNRRQRQSSVGPGGSSALLKHQINSSKRNDNESEKHISRMKPSQSSPIRKSADLDVILAAKKAGGETGSKLENEEPALEDFDNTEHKTPETRTEFLIWLSNAVSEKRLNPSQLDEYFSNYKSTFEYDTGKESQTEEFVYQEVLQKLIKKVSDLYEQFQAEKITNKKLHANFELTHSNDSNKIGLLEAENQEFIDKMKIYTKRFEEEKANNEKLKDKLKEAEKKSKSLEDKEKERVQKFKNLETNLKQKSNIEKELKEISTTCERLSHENSILKKELQKSEEEQHMKLVRMIEDSDEMRNMRSEILFLRGKLSEEANKGKRFLAEQQQTSYKLHETEMKCRDLSQLIEEAKKEMKAKSKEYEDFKRTVEDDKQMMRTELDACKVIKQGALDEIAMLRGKIENLQSKNEKVHNMEKETVEIEQQLRTDLALRDEQILQLQEQIKSLLLERKSGRDISKLKNKMSLEQCQAGAPERANMAAQIIDLQRHVDELANNNLELQKMLADRNAELEQRDHIVKLQTDVLKIRDELIGLLRSKDSTHEKHVEELSSILMEREHAIEKELKKNVESLQAAHLDASADRTKFQKFNASNATDLNRDSSDGARLSLKELHLMFQNKELDLDSMQARIKTLEKNHQNLSHQRIRQETRMRVLEESLQEKSSHTWIPMLVK